MGPVFLEAEQELADVERRCRGNPHAAYVRLLLLALEREQIVSISFRQSVIDDRLRRMPIPEEVRRLISQAVVWIWKDEEMHAVYVRGALMRTGRGSVRLRALAEQLAGSVGGWSAAVLHHARWRTAPLSLLAARLVALAGRVGGRVPSEVGRLLRRCPFRDFCRFNADLERASARCWSVLLRMAGERSDVEVDTLIEFARVVEDEDRHRQVFEAIAGVLTDDDRLLPGADYEGLVGRVRDAGRSFLPRELRGDGGGSVIGSGGRVWCVEGATSEPSADALRRALAGGDLAERVLARAAAVGKSPGELRVVVKGCFMLGYHRADPSPIVAPALVGELARFLRGLGVGRVTLAEARYVYDRFFHNRGVADVARYFGFDSPLYELADLTADTRPHAYVRGLGQGAVGRAWAEADFRISFGKLRSHPVAQASLSLGNLEGVGGRTDDFIFADRMADPATPLMALLDEFPPHYALIDGYDSASHGLVGMMGCRRPLAARRFYLGADPLAVDCVAARHVGITDPAQSALLRATSHWFGGWPRGVEVVGTDAPIAGWRGPQSNDLWAMLSLLALPVYTWGSGRGSLFLPAMDEAAFPPRARPGPLTRAARRLVRGLLGLPSFCGRRGR